MNQMTPDIAQVSPEGLFRFQGQTWRCALGQGGVRPDKSEGDGATPTGPLRLLRVLYRADRVARPVSAVPVEPIGPEDGWCDAPTHRDYNRPVPLPHDASHERLWREDGVYDVIGVLDWNMAPVVPHRGSAIFLHVARPHFAPTEGCVALELPVLRDVLARGLKGLFVDQRR